MDIKPICAFDCRNYFVYTPLLPGERASSVPGPIIEFDAFVLLVATPGASLRRLTARAACRRRHRYSGHTQHH